MGQQTPDIRCSMCGYKFKVTNCIESFYPDTEGYKETRWYPCEKGEHYAHLVKDYVCDKCYKNLSQRLITRLIEDADKYIVNKKARIQRIQEEFNKQIEKINLDCDNVVSIRTKLQEITEISTISPELYTSLNQYNSVLYHVYYLNSFIKEEKKNKKLKKQSEKLTIKELCSLNNISIVELPEDYTMKSLVTRREFLNILKQSGLNGITFNELATLIEKLRSELDY